MKFPTLDEIGIPALGWLVRKIDDFADYLNSWLDLWEHGHDCNCEDAA